MSRIWKKKLVSAKKNFGSDTDTDTFGRYCKLILNFSLSLVIIIDFTFAEVVVTRTDIPEYPEIHPMYSDPWHPHLSTDHSYIYSFPNLSLPPNFNIHIEGTVYV